MRAIDVAGNATAGDIQTNSTKIDTTDLYNTDNPADIGGIDLIENGSPLAFNNFGNPGNTFVETRSGGNITIEGKTIGGNSVCFAAGGTGCLVQDPLPVTNITITADPKTKVYGSADPLFTYLLTSGSLLAGDTFTGSLDRILGENVGSYAINQGTLTATGAGNYSITYIGNFLTITPYQLWVNADAQSKIYGDTDPALTYTFGTLQNGDTSSVFSGSLSRASGENVGNYSINKNTLNAGSNYDIVYTGANFAITPASLVITADDKTKIYGDANPALTASYSGFKNGDDEADLDTAVSLVTSATTGSNVGNYAIEASGATDGNYIISFNNGNLSITPASLVITADDKTKIYGDANPALTASYSGFKNGDDEADLDTAVSLVTSATTGSNVGNYAIEASGATDGNYIISFNNGNLSITPASLVITADSSSKVYGSSDSPLTYSATGLVTGDFINGSLSRDTGENVGTYAINQGSLDAGSNYNVSFNNGILTITPYNLSVTADNKTKVEGESDPLFTYNFASLVNGDDASIFSGDLIRDLGETAGNYFIEQGTLNAGKNYQISFVSGLLTITAKPVNNVVAPFINIDPLNRPIISVADQAINLDLQFEGYEPLTVGTDVSISSIAITPEAFSTIAPAAGGTKGKRTANKVSSSTNNLANIQPAAGGNDTNSIAQYSDIDCANSFLDNKPCGIQN